MIECIIFDLDGTLLNTIDDITEAINRAFSNYGFDTTFSNDEVKSFLGSGSQTLIKRAAQKLFINDEEIEKIHNEYCRIYNFNRTVKTKPFPNMIDVLKTLKQLGIKLAVLSNKPDIDTKACVSFYFDNIFDVVIGQRLDVPIKPDPNGVFEILHSLHVSKKNTIYVGDMKQDKMTAENAKVTFVGCLYGFGEKDMFSGVKHTIENIDDLIPLVEEMNK